MFSLGRTSRLEGAQVETRMLHEHRKVMNVNMVQLVPCFQLHIIHKYHRRNGFDFSEAMPHAKV